MLLSSSALPCLKVRKTAFILIGFSVVLTSLAAMPLQVILGLASGLIMHPASWGPSVAWASCSFFKRLSLTGLLSSDVSTTDLVVENALLRRQLEEATARARDSMSCLDAAEAGCAEVLQFENSYSKQATISEEVQVCKQSAELSQTTAQPASSVPCLHYLYASPRMLGDTVLPQLQIQEELSEIQDALGSDATMSAGVATVTSLRKAVGTPGLWLHLSAHSVQSPSGGSALVLEDGRGLAARAVWQHDLDSMLRAGGGCRAEFVFLAACQSTELARSFHAAGVRHVICCSMPVRDSAARRFAHSLYHELAQKKALRHAFDIAVETARLNDEAVCYSLFSDDAHHGCLPLVTRAPSEFVSVSAPVSASLLPRVIEDFVGRVAVIDELLRALASRRVVSLQCDAPLGRTATLTHLAHHLKLPGRPFAGRVAFFPERCHGGLLIVDDADDVLAAEGSRRLLRRHLQVEGAALLLGCRACADYFDGAEKTLRVRLPPLSAEESVELLLRLCARPLVAADFDAGASERPLARAEAAALLRDRVVPQLGGEPGRIRRAAAATAGRSLQHAVSEALASGSIGQSKRCGAASSAT